MKMWRIVTLTAVLMSIGAALVADFTTWFAPATRMAVFALAAPAAVALAFVLYFNWRDRLKNHVLAGQRDDDLATAA